MSRTRKSRRLYLRDPAIPEVGLGEDYYRPTLRIRVTNIGDDGKAAIFELQQWQVKALVERLRLASKEASARHMREANLWDHTVP